MRFLAGLLLASFLPAASAQVIAAPDAAAIQMERQPDGLWRINGCQLARLPGRET